MPDTTDLTHIVRATRMGASAFRYLTPWPREGRVVSTFSEGVNALFEEDTDPRFVTVQSFFVPLHPWAVEVEIISPSPKPGCSCYVGVDAIYFPFGLGFRVKLDDVEIADLVVQSWTREEAQYARTRIPFVRASVGTIHEEGMLHLFHPPFSKNSQGTTEEDFENAARKLIGLGSGSTPSGDDFIVGQLAVLGAVRSFSDRADRQIRGFQTIFHWDDLVKRTPLPSAQMVMAAAEGQFPEYVPAFISAIAREPDINLAAATVKLVSLGGTSGMEMLSGVLEALQHLDN